MKQTANQKLAIESWDRSTAIIAGAGSGKTEVLTQRLLQIIGSKKVDLSQILAITFTEKAASELKRRIAKNLSPQQREELPWAAIGTFSSFCLNLLKEYAPLLGYPGTTTVWKEPRARLAIHKQCRKTVLEGLERKDSAALFLVEEIEWRYTLSLLEELLQYPWHADQMWKNQITTEDKKEKRLWEAAKHLFIQAQLSYQNEKREKQVFDFQDLENLCWKLLKNYPDIRTQLQHRFKHILVDEAQDLNDLQRSILEDLFSPQKNIFCLVGDPQQSIYRFRGANPRGFQKLVHKVLESNGLLIELRENFRSRPPLLHFVNQTFQNLFSKTEPGPLEPTRENGEQPSLWQFVVPSGEKQSSEDRRKEEALAIAKIILYKVKREEKKFDDFCLLFQSLNDVRHYTQTFQKAGIPYRLHGGGGFLQTQEVYDLSFVLKILANLEDRMALIGLMRSPLVGFSDLYIAELATQHPKDLGKQFLKCKEGEWFRSLYETREERNAADLLEEVLAKTGYPALLTKLDLSGTKLANVEQWIELVRNLEGGEDMQLSEIISYFEDLQRRKATLSTAPAIDLSHDCCALMTIHAAKGLEFPIVILPDLLRRPPSSSTRAFFSRDFGIGFGLREKANLFHDYLPTERTVAIKKREREEEIEERKRLLYVALTRAQEELVLPHYETKDSGSLWHAWLQESLSQREPLPILNGDLDEEGEREEKKETKDFSLLEIPEWEWSSPYLTVTQLKEKLKEAPPSKSIPRDSDKDLKGALFGDLVHAVLKNIQDPKTIDLHSLIHKAAMNLEIPITGKKIKETAQLLAQFLASDIAPPTWKGEHELPFKLKRMGYVISGVIDYAWETEKGWILCDFKTDARPNPKKYRHQLDIYALALSKGLSKPVIETRLLFLKSNKAYIEAVSQRRLDQTEMFLQKWIQNN